MRKKLFIVLLFFALISSFNTSVLKVNAQESFVRLGGFPVGFSIDTKGVQVAGICDVLTKDGVKTPSKDANIKLNDVITHIDNVAINKANEIALNIYNKEKVKLTIERQGEIIEREIKIEKDINGNDKLGLFIKDEINGIGTITYIKDRQFASLGHPIINDRGHLLKIYGGDAFNCSITGCVKGERGKAGEIRGVISRNEKIGTIEKNTPVGVYGELEKDFDINKLKKIKIGLASQGKASIITTINNRLAKEYSISIIKVNNDNSSKNFVVKITDKKLLSETGGIVQGMSGSPIVQNGKIVGAITHVFINDPTKGFGVSIFNMLDNN